MRWKYDSVKVYLENGSEYITDIASNLTDKTNI